MNSEEFKNIIAIKKPRYANSRIPVFEAFANKGKSKSEYSQFGPIYELYIYAFILGIKKDISLPLPPRNLTTDFVEISKWKSGTSLVDFLMMIIFTKCDEIEFTWNQLEDMDDKELNITVNNIITSIESYANGGLKFLQDQYEKNTLINSSYVFVDLLAENSTFKEEEEIKSLEIEEADEDIVMSTQKLINIGESSNIELKSTLRVNLHTNKPDDKMELMCMKTIAGFMNSKSGRLIIGVSDVKEILGLKADFDSFGNKDDLKDEFSKHLDNLIAKFLDNSVYSLMKIYFPEIEGEMICRIDVRFRKSGPIYLKYKNSETFYMRRAASTVALHPSEIVNYIENIWK